MSDDRTEEEIGFQIGYERTEYGFCRQDLDAMGERAVRNDLNSGKYGHVGIPVFSFVSAWLADAEFARLAADSAKRDEREDRTLAIAENALSIAKDANRIASEDLAAARLNARWAMWAAIIATIAATIATKDQIVALVISWLP